MNVPKPKFNVDDLVNVDTCPGLRNPWRIRAIYWHIDAKDYEAGPHMRYSVVHPDLDPDFAKDIDFAEIELSLKRL